MKPAGPGAIAAGGGLAAADAGKDEPPKAPEEYSATGIDNAIDLLEVVTAKMDKASVGSQAAGLERHPEVRCAIHACFLSALTDGWQTRRDASRLRSKRTRSERCRTLELMWVRSKFVSALR